MKAISYVVPVEGIEPPLLAEHDFESCASTSTATRAILVEHDPFGKPGTTFPVMLFLVEHDPIGKPATTFPGHALGALYIARSGSGQKKIKTSRPCRRAMFRPCIRLKDRHSA